MHAAGGAGDLVLEGRARDGQRVGVGHLEDAGDAAHHRRQRAGRKIFLVLQPRLAEMHLGVDDAGQDVQAAAVDGLVGGVADEIAERGDAAAATRRCRPMDAVLVDDGPCLKIRS